MGHGLILTIVFEYTIVYKNRGEGGRDTRQTYESMVSFTEVHYPLQFSNTSYDMNEFNLSGFPTSEDIYFRGNSCA